MVACAAIYTFCPDRMACTLGKKLYTYFHTYVYTYSSMQDPLLKIGGL